MWESIMKLVKKIKRKNDEPINSKDAAKERLHLVLMQDRANVSADFLELMKQEIIEVIKKYIDIDESSIDVRLTNKENDDGTKGAPALYANIPIVNIKDEVRQNSKTNTENNKDEQEKEEEQVKQKEKIKQETETKEIKTEDAQEKEDNNVDIKIQEPEKKEPVKVQVSENDSENKNIEE